MEEFLLEHIGEWGVFAISAFIGFAFKDAIQNFFVGLQFHWGHDFDVDDIVYIKGVKKARIVRQNIWKTAFYVFPHERKFVVPNHMLWKLEIEKELPQKMKKEDI